MNRRHFIALLAGGAGIVAATPVRRFWAVGATLERPFGIQDIADWWATARLDLESRGARFAHIQQRWHDNDFAQELRDYPGSLDDSVRISPKVVHQDVRFAKMRTEVTAEDFRRMARDLEAQGAKPHSDGRYHIHLPPSAVLYLGNQELEAVGPIVIHTEIAEGYRS